MEYGPVRLVGTDAEVTAAGWAALAWRTDSRQFSPSAGRTSISLQR